jgi:hypothetical protein
MYLLRSLQCHLIFHYLHYHLVNWDHLLIVLILFLRLIKPDHLTVIRCIFLLTLLNFEISCSETILWPDPLPFKLLYLSMHLIVHFEAFHPLMWPCFGPLSKLYSSLLFSLNLPGHLPTSIPNYLHKPNSSQITLEMSFMLLITPLFSNIISIRLSSYYIFSY